MAVTFQPTLHGEDPAIAIARSGLEAQLTAARTLLDEPRLHLPLDLQFTWRRMAFYARLETSSNAQARLSLEAELGLLPYSIEDPGARQAALAGLRDLNREDRDLWSAGIDGRVWLVSKTDLAAPQTHPEALAALALLLLTLKPRLELLAPLLHPAERTRTRRLAQAV